MAQGLPHITAIQHVLASRALQVCRLSEGETYADTAVLREGERATIDGKEIEIGSLLPKAPRAQP